MTDDARDTVKALDRQRKQARSKLSGDAEQARYDLHPRTLARSWTDDKKAKLAGAVDDGKHALKKNAPMIGLASAAILLFAARKPIFNAIDALRKKRSRPRTESHEQIG